MNTNKILIGVVALILIILGGLYYAKTNQKTSANPATIKIGVVLSLSSYGAQDGEAIKQGLDLAQMKLRGEGVNVELIYQDDATDPKQNISATRQLLSTGVDALIGWQWSYLLQPSLPIINEARVVTFAPSLGYDIVNMPSDYVFYGYIKNEKKIEPLTEWFRSQNIKKPAFFVNNIAWGDAHLNIFKEAISRAGGEEVLAEKISFGSESETLPTLIAKAKSLGADAILWSGSYDGQIILVKKMGELNISAPFLSDEGIIIPISKKQIPSNQTRIFTFSKESSSSEEFREMFKKQYKMEPLHFSDAAYDSLMILVKAILKHGSIPLNDYIRQNTKYEGYNTR